MAVKIITDGGADLPPELTERYQLSMVPLHVMFGEESFDLSSGHASFYQKMKAYSALPKTASPSPSDFLTAFERHAEDDLLVITVSSGLSSTYQHAVLAREMLREKGFTGKLEIVDSQNASVGLGLIVYRAACDVAEGVPFEQVVERTRDRAAETKIYIYLNTLENVVKGGRLDRTKAAIASVLNIKLIMHNKEGVIEVLEKVRGQKNALARLVQKLDDMRGPVEDKTLGIAHSQCEREARSLMERIVRSFPFRDVVFTEMGPVIGTYAGEGGILVSYV